MSTNLDTARDKAYADYWPSTSEDTSVYGIWCAAWAAALHAKQEARPASDGAEDRPAGSSKESGTDEKEVSALLTPRPDSSVHPAGLDSSPSNIGQFQVMRPSQYGEEDQMLADGFDTTADAEAWIDRNEDTHAYLPYVEGPQ